MDSFDGGNSSVTSSQRHKGMTSSYEYSHSKRPRGGSISGRLRTVSDLEDKGIIDRVLKGMIKDKIICGDKDLENALDQFEQGDTSQIEAMIARGDIQRGESVDFLDALDFDFLGGNTLNLGGDELNNNSVGGGGVHNPGAAAGPGQGPYYNSMPPPVPMQGRKGQGQGNQSAFPAPYFGHQGQGQGLGGDMLPTHPRSGTLGDFSFDQQFDGAGAGPVDGHNMPMPVPMHGQQQQQLQQFQGQGQGHGTYAGSSSSSRRPRNSSIDAMLGFAPGQGMGDGGGAAGGVGGSLSAEHQQRMRDRLYSGGGSFGAGSFSLLGGDGRDVDAFLYPNGGAAAGAGGYGYGGAGGGPTVNMSAITGGRGSGNSAGAGAGAGRGGDGAPKFANIFDEDTENVFYQGQEEQPAAEEPPSGRGRQPKGSKARGSKAQGGRGERGNSQQRSRDPSPSVQMAPVHAPMQQQQQNQMQHQQQHQQQYASATVPTAAAWTGVPDASGGNGGASPYAMGIGYPAPSSNGTGTIGTYTPEARRERIERFLEKRSRRVWTKRVKYDVRKNFADSRIRVKGRFVKKEDEEILRELKGFGEDNEEEEGGEGGGGDAAGRESVDDERGEGGRDSVR